MIVISPTASFDGKFSILHDDGYSLFTPSGLGNIEASSSYCTASTTPMYDDCDVSGTGSLGVGTWIALDASTSPTRADYEYQGATSTASTLWQGTMQEAVQLINASQPFVWGALGLTIAVLAALLIGGALTGGARSMRGHR